MPAPTSRRRFLIAGGTVAAVALAGCSDDSSVGEVESGIEETEAHLQGIDPKLEDAAVAIDDQDWEGCHSQADAIRSDLDAARQSSDDALSLAEEDGLSDHVAVLERMQEYIAIVEEMTGELDQACEAGAAGDQQGLEAHWNTLMDLDDDRQSKREEVSAALDELR